MSSFFLTEQQQMVQNMARDFAKNEVLPLAQELDATEMFPSGTLKKMAELGLLSMMVSEEFGGSGLDMLSYVLALEQISCACASTAVTMSVHNSLFCGPIEKHGTPAQKDEFLRPATQGQILGAYCLSEPGTGSDAANQKTLAKIDGDFFILDGTKNWITNGPNADVFIVFAMTNPELKTRGITAFIVKKSDAGFKVGKIEHKHGIRGSSTSQIILDSVKVPANRVLGTVGGGFGLAMNTLDYGRIGIATQALGISECAFDFANRYASEREAFGEHINQFQAIQWMLADMSVRIEAARGLVYKAARLKDLGKPCTLEAAQAKLFASETSNFVTDKAVQIHGGFGYSREYPVERLKRDARITEIYEGTSEIQRLVIARHLVRDQHRYFLD